MPDEPLIFVEVALVDALTDCITPLSWTSPPTRLDLNAATTAIFYSISNTQDGLRGVSFGDSLIKRVVETLKAEFPQPQDLCDALAHPRLPQLVAEERNGPAWSSWTTLAREELGRAVRLSSRSRPRTFWRPAESPLLLSSPASPVQHHADALRGAVSGPGDCCTASRLDPVARFHLGNGARVERLNWAGDPSVQRHQAVLRTDGELPLRPASGSTSTGKGWPSGRIPVASPVSNLFF